MTTKIQMNRHEKDAMKRIEAEAVQFARRAFHRLGERPTDKKEGERKARAAWSVFCDLGGLDDRLWLLDDRLKCEAVAVASFTKAFTKEWSRLRQGTLALS